jgi:hypothetical protein
MRNGNSEAFQNSIFSRYPAGSWARRIVHIYSWNVLLFLCLSPTHGGYPWVSETGGRFLSTLFS